MHAPEPYLIFTRRLQALGLRYMVSGSVAAIFYGEPRMTNDVDIILAMRREDVGRLVAAFPETDFYCPPEEVIFCELAREQRGHINLIHHETGFKADIYLMGRDALHAWGLAGAVGVEIEEDTVCFAPPEYVMIRKLQFFREGGSRKHLRDIQRMLVSLGEEWSQAELDRLIRLHRLEREWEFVKSYSE